MLSNTAIVIMELVKLLMLSSCSSCIFSFDRNEAMLWLGVKCRKGCTLQFNSSLGDGIWSEIGVHGYLSKLKCHGLPVSIHLHIIYLTVCIALSAGLLW